MQLSLFTDPISSSLAPTNLTSSRHPIHRLANFIAGYSPEFVSACIREASLSPGDTVLDPFGGLGTTPVQSLLDGFSCIVCEANPYFADIAAAKCQAALGNVEPDEIFSKLHQLVPYEGDLAYIYSVDALKFLQKLIPEIQLRFLVSARLKEIEITPRNKLFYRLVVSIILELSSKSQTDGIYKAPTTKKKSIAFQDALSRIQSQVMEDIPSVVNRQNIYYDLIRGSAHLLSEKPSSLASLCVTSPPYLNNFDYAEMSRMELYFWGYASSWRNITNQVRSILIPNTTTIPTEIKKKHELYANQLSVEFREYLKPLVDDLKNLRIQRAGKKNTMPLFILILLGLKKYLLSVLDFLNLMLIFM